MKKIFVFIISLFIISCSISEKDNNLSGNSGNTITIKEIIIGDTPQEICARKINSVSQEISIQESSVNLLDLFYHAKTHPVWLIEEPKLNPTDSKLVKSNRSNFEKSNPWSFITSETNKKFYKWKPEVAREVFLRNGYLYHPDPLIANIITRFVALDILVKEKSFLIQRGHLLMQVQRINESFFYKSGPYIGRAVTIEFLDRIIIDETNIPKPLHIDFTTAKDKYFFDKISPTHITEKHVIANVQYNDLVIQTLFNRNGVEVSIECEMQNAFPVRDSRKTRFKGISLLKSAMMDQVLERVPFDEPKYEVQQEDGNLRDVWMRYFYRGRLKYQYKNERMVEVNNIYDHLGKPIPPQVCVDFLVDTIDRASGSWYTSVNNRGSPIKTEGVFNSSNLRYKDENEKDQHYAIRNVSGFTQFTRDYPNWFEIINVSPRVNLGSSSFYEYLQTLKLQEGDMVFIRGSVPWDKKEEHSHSFFIYQTDPVTGMPILLAGNAGTASLRPWKIETDRTPNRAIVRIIRIKDPFLALLNKN